MIQIRQDVFETNSSSSHSLVVRSEKLLNELDTPIYETVESIAEEFKYELKHRGIFRIENSYGDRELYYGRAPFRILSGFKNKWLYAFADLVCYDYEASSQKIIEDTNYRLLFNLLREYCPDLKEFVLPESWGTDDHMLLDWLDNNKIDLKEFLTNNRYVVICDGDEYNIWSDFVDTGLFNNKIADWQE